MSLMAGIKDGQIVQSNASTNSLKNAKEQNASGIDSDAFLQLLVAEMQNQDPLEPTSNTEWVSQYAQFTQVSEVQEIGKAITNQNAQGLVGEYVIMKVTNEKGNTDYVSGKVDYTTMEDGEAYLSINGSLYSIKDLDTVSDPDYMEAYELATDIANALKKLPKVDNISMVNKEAIDDISKKVDGMNSYQRSFLDKSVYEKIDEYVAALRHLESKVDDKDNTSSEGESEANNE